jgi:hypothetical protein
VPDEPRAVNWRDLPPIPVEAQPTILGDPDFTPSQTFLRAMDRCDGAALLYLQHRGGGATHELNRGSIVHETIDRLIRLLIEAHRQRAAGAGGTDFEYEVTAGERAEQLAEQREDRIPPEYGREILYEVMADNPEMQVSAEERDACRYMIDHFCRGTRFDPKTILGVEKTLTLETGGFRVLIRPDLLEEPEPRVLRIRDWKTAWPPDSEDFRAQAYDDQGNPRWAGNYQLNMTAVVAAFGITDDGLPLGNFDRFILDLEFPRILRNENGEKKIDQRRVEVDRLQVQAFRDDLDLQLHRLRTVCIDKRKWQPTPGNHCAECTAEVACRLPRVLRPESQMADLQDVDDLAEAGTRWHFMTRSAERLKRRLKKAAEAILPEALESFTVDDEEVKGVRIGKDLALVFMDVEKTEVPDRDNLLAAAEAAANFGEPFDRDDHVKKRTAVEFKKRKVAPE